MLCGYQRLKVVIVLGFIFGFSASYSKEKTTPKTPAKKISQSKMRNKEEAPLLTQKSFLRDIQIEGQRKIEKDAILNRIKLKVGQSYSKEELRENLREDVTQLFKSGFFFNVEVNKTEIADGFVLKYKVFEKPSIAEIAWEGISEDVKKEELQEALGVKEFEILNMAKLKEGQEKIQKYFEDKGFFLAKIDIKTEDLVKNETVKLKINLKQNDRVKVKKITFLGNKKLSDSALIIDQLISEEGFFTGLSGSGQFKQDMFERWIQGIRFIYFNQGYIQAKIDRPQVTVTPDKKGIYITIHIEEGEQFEVGEIDFSGDVLFSRDELLETIKLDENKIFAYDVLQKDLVDLQAKYGDLGYAFANVNPQWKVKEKERKVDLVFEFDKGNKVYFGRIQIVGNSKTRDKVLRREMKILEGELYNETRRRQSLENIQRLGFFDEVNFKTSTPPDKLDIMNIDVVIKERNTGQIQVGAGYGSSQGFTLQGSVQQTNFLGRGQNLGVSLNLAKNYSMYDVSFTEPYFRDSIWSLGFRVFRSENSGRADYDETKTGGSIFLGHPLGDYLRFNASYTYSATRLFAAKVNDVVVTDFDLFPLNTAEGDAGLLGLSLDYDTRNDRFKPSKGIHARLGYSVTGPFGGNLRYYKANTDFKFFKNLFWDVVFRNSISYARIESTDPTRNPPFNELYLLGGPYSLRGYRYPRVGKQVVSQKAKKELQGKGETVDLDEKAKRFYGGSQQLIYQGELMFPLIREAQMYGVTFYDVGQANDVITEGNFFADTGFGIRWFSPIGPLRFEWGFPLNRDTYWHEAVVFEFSIGAPF